ncbi:MAG: hypothetical protein IKM09_02890, partial [Clostridia bacterium]|nr:hypothetical protein [Clostridia bacterium]
IKIQPNYRTEYSQITEQNTAKLPKNIKPNYRKIKSQITENCCCVLKNRRYIRSTAGVLEVLIIPKKRIKGLFCQLPEQTPFLF